MTDTTTKAAPARAPDHDDQTNDRDALTRLEEELLAIKGLARCLQLMGEGRYVANSDAFNYAGDRLRAHHDAAREAFDEVFEAMKQKPAAEQAKGDAA